MSEPVARTPEEWFAILRGEVNELGNALGEAIRTLSGDALFAHEEAVRALTKEARRGRRAAANVGVRATAGATSWGRCRSRTPRGWCAPSPSICTWRTPPRSATACG